MVEPFQDPVYPEQGSFLYMVNDSGKAAYWFYEGVLPKDFEEIVADNYLGRAPNCAYPVYDARELLPFLLDDLEAQTSFN